MGASASTHSEASSGASVDERKLLWKIENFDVMRNSENLMRNQELEFNAGVSIGLPTKWVCSLKIYSDTQTKWMGVILKLVDKPENAEEVNVSFDILIRKSKGIFFQDSVPLIDMVNTSSAVDCGFKRVIKCDSKTADLPLTNGTLEIELVFRLYASKPRQTLNSELPNKLEMFKMKAAERLIKDLGQTDILTGAKTDAATKVVSKDNVIFPVNRGLLSVRSKVLEKMFQSGMQEARTGIVNMSELSSKTVKVLLEYVNRGVLHADWKHPEVVEELCVAAHYYDLTLFVEFLDEALGTVCNNVSVQKAVRLAKLAKTLGMKKAEVEMMVYIKERSTNVDDFVFTAEMNE